MSDNPSRTTVETSLRKPILIAGLLGGLLGGVASFAASRLIKPAGPPPTTSVKDQSLADTKHIVEGLLDELRAGKNEEFMAHVRMAYPDMTDDKFKEYKVAFDNSRRIFEGVFGKSLNKFELIGENAISLDLVHLVYLEKYERGGVIWRFYLYFGKDSWYLTYVKWERISHESFLH